MLFLFVLWFRAATQTKKQVLQTSIIAQAIFEIPSRGPVFKATGWLQGRLRLSSFRGR